MNGRKDLFYYNPEIKTQALSKYFIFCLPKI